MPVKPTVMIVDDAPDIRKMIVEMLGLEGYVVETAANGQEALDRVADGKPRVILLDLLMPVLDGRGFLTNLGARPADRARYKVILVSAFSNLEQARDLKADGALPKPFTVDQLMNAIAAVGVPA
jgi:CheY-like chemotaxis protein